MRWSRARRKVPYFDLQAFGSRFRDPALKRRLAASLSKAGLKWELVFLGAGRWRRLRRGRGRWAAPLVWLMTLLPRRNFLLRN